MGQINHHKFPPEKDFSGMESLARYSDVNLIEYVFTGTIFQEDNVMSFISLDKHLFRKEKLLLWISHQEEHNFIKL